MLKKLVRKIVRWANSGDAVEKDYSMAANSVVGRVVGNSINERSNGLNLTIYTAIGGRVIQTHSYNPLTDRSKSELYIVHDNEDLGQELGQILTRISLTQ